jgi:hypothetical protein
MRLLAQPEWLWRQIWPQHVIFTRLPLIKANTQIKTSMRHADLARQTVMARASCPCRWLLKDARLC